MPEIGWTIEAVETLSVKTKQPVIAAGKNIANPYSMIGSVAMLLDKAFGLRREAEEVWQALFAVFERGCTTAELAPAGAPESSVLSTSAFGEMVCAIIGEG